MEKFGIIFPRYLNQAGRCWFFAISHGFDFFSSKGGLGSCKASW
jgi:hypothetical protein